MSRRGDFRALSAAGRNTGTPVVTEQGQGPPTREGRWVGERGLLLAHVSGMFSASGSDAPPGNLLLAVGRASSPDAERYTPRGPSRVQPASGFQFGHRRPEASVRLLAVNAPARVLLVNSQRSRAKNVTSCFIPGSSMFLFHKLSRLC